MSEEEPRRPQPSGDADEEPEIDPNLVDHLERGAKIGPSREAEPEE